MIYVRENKIYNVGPNLVLGEKFRFGERYKHRIFDNKRNVRLNEYNIFDYPTSLRIKVIIKPLNTLNFIKQFNLCSSNFE